MGSKRGIQVGEIYTIEVERTRIQVQVIAEAEGMPGWWLCQSAQGDQIILPRDAFPSAGE